MKRVLPVILGIVIIAVGVFLTIKSKDLEKKCTAEAVGTVVEIVREETQDEDNFTRYTYYPVIEYKAGDRTVTKQSSTGSGTSEYNVNDKIDILYNPDNVEEYIIKGDKTSNIIGIIFIVVGIVVSVLGVIKKF